MYMRHKTHSTITNYVNNIIVNKTFPASEHNIEYICINAQILNYNFVNFKKKKNT